jgi:hypothetical protein
VVVVDDEGARVVVVEIGVVVSQTAMRIMKNYM